MPSHIYLRVGRYHEATLANEQTLKGAALLQAGKAADAERIYREDLIRHPENGWSLYGLLASLRAQGQTEEANAVAKRFRDVWRLADVTLTASRF